MILSKSNENDGQCVSSWCRYLNNSIDDWFERKQCRNEADELQQGLIVQAKGVFWALIRSFVVHRAAMPLTSECFIEPSHIVNNQLDTKGLGTQVRAERYKLHNFLPD